MTHIEAYVHCKNIRLDGRIDAVCTYRVYVKENLLWWQEKGLSFTRSGYGKRIPTPYMVKFNGKWRRVYCCIYSNSGTLYIGKLTAKGESIIVQIN